MNESEERGHELLLRGLEMMSQGPEAQVQARALVLEAAESNIPGALFFASEMLCNGWGGGFDRARAFDFLVRAAELGQTDAIYSLGYCYLAGGMGNLGYSDEVLNQKQVPRDVDKALALLTQAADAGHGLAALRIAEHWESESEDQPKLLMKAIDWYERSAVLGEPNSLIHLADFLILGKGVEKDHDQARQLYQQAAESDDHCAVSAATQRLEQFDRLERILGDEGS